MQQRKTMWMSLIRKSASSSSLSMGIWERFVCSIISSLPICSVNNVLFLISWKTGDNRMGHSVTGNSKLWAKRLGLQILVLATADWVWWTQHRAWIKAERTHQRAWTEGCSSVTGPFQVSLAIPKNRPLLFFQSVLLIDLGTCCVYWFSES